MTAAPNAPAKPPDPEIRPAHPSEYEMLRELEEEADQLYADLDIGPFASADEENHLEQAAAVLVCGTPPVGFACIEVVDGEAHLWQLSVLPSAGRRGVGSALVAAACEWARTEGHRSVTLTTYRDVPWNAPFYTRLGFRETDELGPGLLAIREHEKEIGDDAFGARIAMRKELSVRRGR